MGTPSRQTDWVPEILPGVNRFSITVSDAVVEHPEGVVTITLTVVVAVYGAAGLKSTEVSVLVAVMVWLSDSLIINS